MGQPPPLRIDTLFSERPSVRVSGSGRPHPGVQRGQLAVARTGRSGCRLATRPGAGLRWSFLFLVMVMVIVPSMLLTRSARRLVRLAAGPGGDRDLQDCGDLLGPRRRGRLLERIEVCDPGGIAAVSLGDRDDVQAGNSRPGTPGACSRMANDLRIAYSSFCMTTISIGSRSRAAVQIDWTEYWNEPSPMTAMTGRLRPESRSASAIPTGGRQVPAQPAAGERVERVRLGDRPCRVQVGQVGRALLDQDGMIGPDLVQGGEDLRGGQHAIRGPVRRRRVRRHPVRQPRVRLGGGRGVAGEQVGEPGQGQDGVAEQAVADRCAAGLGRVVGDVQQPQRRAAGTGRQRTGSTGTPARPRPGRRRARRACRSAGPSRTAARPRTAGGLRGTGSARTTGRPRPGRSAPRRARPPASTRPPARWPRRRSAPGRTRAG